MKIKQTWSELKTTISGKNLRLQYKSDGNEYLVWGREESDLYYALIDIDSPANADQQDFEDNYKSEANKPLHPITPDSKTKVVSVSRPDGTTTCFTTCGDDTVANTIGTGKRVEWDFSNSNDEIATPPTGKKVKRIEFQFIDPVYMKEGTIYFFNAVKNSYVDFWVVCPDGEIYLDNDGSPQVASGDVLINHWVIKHPIQGDVPMGDELNTEAAQETPVPTNYKLRAEICVPDTDNTSNGCVELELYRTRTVVL